MSELWPFVGRDGEIAAIIGAISADRPIGMVVTGAAGVGKSRLLRQAAGMLDVTRYAVFAVAGTEATSCIPLGAFADLLPAGSPPGAATSQLLREIMEHLRQLTGERRTVLVVDDLHLLDPLDATLVYYAARNGGATVIATRRPGIPVDAATALWKEDLTSRIELSPLGVRDTSTLLTRVLGGPVEPSTVHRLWTLAEGNVLMLREVVTTLTADGRLSAVGGRWHWTGSMPQAPDLLRLILARLGDLDPAIRHAVELVTFGEGIGLALLTAAIGNPAVEEAESQNLIRLERSGRRVNVNLAHPLHGEAVRQTVPTLHARSRRAELIGLVRATGARRRNDMLRLAIWSLDSGQPADPQLMLQAARMAYADLDMHLAARLAAAAGNSVDAVELRSYALAYGGDPRAAIDVLEQAAAGTGGGWDRARLMTARDTHAFAALGDQTTLAEHAAARIGVTDADAAAWVADHELVRRLWSGQFEHVRHALADRGTLPDGSPSRLLIDVAVACMAAFDGRYRDSLERAERIIELGNAAITLPYLQVAATYIRSAACLIGGALDLLEPHLDAFERMGSARYFPLIDGQLAIARAAVSRVGGHVSRASESARDAIACFESTGLLYRPLAFAELAHAAALSADTDLARAMLAQADHALGPNASMLYPWVELARIQVAASADSAHEAAGLAVRLAARLRGDELPGYEVHAWHAVVRHVGPAPDAVRRLGELARSVAAPLAIAAAEHAHALSTGDSLAVLSAADSFSRLGMDLYAAEAAGQAFTIARSHGQAPDLVVARLAELVERCDACHTPALTISLAELTAREIEIADLAAAGLTGSQIAQRLYLSPRTPDSHLQRIYTKLGITGRSQLASMLRLYRSLPGADLPTPPAERPSESSRRRR